MKTLTTLTFVFVVQFVFAQTDNYKNVYSEPAWKERDTWQKPKELINRLAIEKGSHVADIGCHEGYMSFKLSEVVGSEGKVYAVDVRWDKLDKVKSRAKKLHINNIDAVQGDFDNPKLPEGILDAVIILDTYHEMDDHDDILEHVMKSLKPGGRLVLCEPIADSRKNLSRSEQEGKHELEMKFAIEDLTRAGFKVQEQQENFIDRVKVKGDRMWLVVAVK